MEFCPKCGAVLVQKRKNDGCPRCNYSSKGKSKLTSSEKMGEKKKLAVVKEDDSEVHPVTTETCKKCGNNKAYFWEIQTRASDESPTKFFKCTKCGHTRKSYR